jgi:hypothetical protein
MPLKLAPHRLRRLGGEVWRLVVGAMVALGAVLAFLFWRRGWI